jgi:hypothetical protein
VIAANDQGSILLGRHLLMMALILLLDAQRISVNLQTQKTNY